MQAGVFMFLIAIIFFAGFLFLTFLQVFYWLVIIAIAIIVVCILCSIVSFKSIKDSNTQNRIPDNSTDEFDNNL